MRIKVRLQIRSVDLYELDKIVSSVEKKGLKKNHLAGPVPDLMYMGSEDLSTYHVQFYCESEEEWNRLLADNLVDGLDVISAKKMINLNPERSH